MVNCLQRFILTSLHSEFHIIVGGRDFSYMAQPLSLYPLREEVFKSECSLHYHSRPSVLVSKLLKGFQPGTTRQCAMLKNMKKRHFFFSQLIVLTRLFQQLFRIIFIYKVVELVTSRSTKYLHYLRSMNFLSLIYSVSDLICSNFNCLKNSLQKFPYTHYLDYA